MGVANTTFISTYAVLWRDFPFERPDRIAIMRTLDARGREAGLSFADYQDWRRDARVFDGPSAAFAIGTISLGRDGAAPEQFDGLYVSADTFSVLRVKPQLGRDFSAAAAQKPWPSFPATSGRAGTRPAATCWGARSR